MDFIPLGGNRSAAEAAAAEEEERHQVREWQGLES
jgi:hypothetical protein